MPRALTKLLLIASLFFGTSALGHTRIDQAEQHADIAPSKHPFFAPLHHTFVPAGELSEGSPLSLSNGTRATVVGLRRRAADDGTMTYNFEVEDFHTYFVGESGVWVHNQGAEQCKKAFALWHRLMDKNGQKHWEAMNSLFTRIPKQADKFLEMLSLRQAVFKDVLKAKYPNGARVWPSKHPWRLGTKWDSVYSLKSSKYSGDLDFIVTKNGELRVGESHSFLANGDDVISAGQATFKDGTLRRITNGSGHYTPAGVDPGIPEGAWLSNGFDEALGTYKEAWTWR